MISSFRVRVRVAGPDQRLCIMSFRLLGVTFFVIEKNFFWEFYPVVPSCASEPDAFGSKRQRALPARYRLPVTGVCIPLSRSPILFASFTASSIVGSQDILATPSILSQRVRRVYLLPSGYDHEKRPYVLCIRFLCTYAKAPSGYICVCAVCADYHPCRVVRGIETEK